MNTENISKHLEKNNSLGKYINVCGIVDGHVIIYIYGFPIVIRVIIFHAYIHICMI